MIGFPFEQRLVVNLNIDKAKSRYGWTPNTSLDEGIQKTLRWYREHLLGESVASCA